MSAGESAIRFGTDGWRAIMCDTFTFNNVRIVVQAIAAYLLDKDDQRPVFVGHDARFLAERFADEACGVLAASGIRTLRAPTDLPTPVVAFAVTHVGCAGAIMFTASHNPPEYNGIKFIPDYGGPASPEITHAIEQNIRNLQAQASGVVTHTDITAAKAEGLVRMYDPKGDYLKHIEKILPIGSLGHAHLGVVYDPMYGSGRHYLEEMLHNAGARVSTLHNHRDPLFGGRMPDPTAHHLGDLVQHLKHSGAEIGLATDGDADRFGVVDTGGHYLSANQVISLLFVHLVEHFGLEGSVVRTVATTHLLDRLAAKYGRVVHETPVGFKHICDMMRKEPVVIGGEESGGLSIGPHIPEKDGLLANLLVAHMRAVRGKPLHSVLGEIMDEVGTSVSRRVDLKIPDERKGQLVHTLAQTPPERIGNWPVESVSTIDGVKLLLVGDRWVLARPSGTEPLLRLYMEAPTEGDLESIQAALQTVIDRV